jgi:hypothetical protein
MEDIMEIYSESFGLKLTIKAQQREIQRLTQELEEAKK